ncbi:MAG TPA: glycosyltransferase [Thermomicrobiales bacterium]|nr:glycosyltransferase [Thermomicrobiales bacterium]
MRRLKILTWHIHGSYLHSLAHVPVEWYLPVKPDRRDGYGGRGDYQELPATMIEVPAEEVRTLDLDAILLQTPKNLFEDTAEILNSVQRRLPRVYLEHNVPRPHAVETRHPFDDPDGLLVHVTHYNRLMWDNGATPTKVIEHSVAIDPGVTYDGSIPAGITVANSMPRRNRITGLDLFLAARQQVPLEVVGIDAEKIGGRPSMLYRDLHRFTSRYRFLFSPMRYTSLPLAVVEAMTIGMPVVALATTELPTVIENEVTGYISCEPDELIARMKQLLRDPALARRLGANAREVALARFGLDRFARDWGDAFEDVVDRHPASLDVVGAGRSGAV